ncbi:MAG: Holliday junction resolvase RuvX [Opitutae bacterium]|jgi:putative holliday junction resolvase|nr:Holliday junction resolvase RuvX [Opitutae bacterium]
MPVCLGIDYGTKRMGLAWADELGIALPLKTIPGVDSQGCWDELRQVVEERRVSRFVVGYPLHMDGSVGKRAKEVDQFVSRLEDEFDLPVSKVDERLTSLAAEEALGKKAKPKDGKIDATAASLILKDFLDGGNVIE